MPAWIAGIHTRTMRPETSLSTWVPAVHARTTDSCSNLCLRYANLKATGSLTPIFEGDVVERGSLFFKDP
jgi:hypothetical protein